MKKILALVMLLAACDDDDQQIVQDAAVSDASACSAPQVLRYEQAGCTKTPSCGSATMDLCLRLACSCAGKVIGGCDYYREPWTTTPVPTGAKEGDSCATD